MMRNFEQAMHVLVRTPVRGHMSRIYYYVVDVLHVHMHRVVRIRNSNMYV